MVTELFTYDLHGFSLSALVSLHVIRIRISSVCMSATTLHGPRFHETSHQTTTNGGKRKVEIDARAFDAMDRCLVRWN